MGWAGKNKNSIRLRTKGPSRPVEVRKMTDEEWENRKRRKK
jgi:hypothetical protein